ncbi:MAG: Multidrug resistance protein MdtK [Chlamydiae bacterium]|nr:Multidrug resistance protein MdtK [Chlamydiota bacterium]
MLMLFVDRLLLAKYSQEAFNAAVSASTLGWALVFGWLVLTNISEVFVAQYNGAQKYEKIGSPVWQMMWLALASVLFFVPLAIWGGQLFFPQSEYSDLQREYFRWMIIFGPSYPIYGALTGFFVGRGKVVIITILSIITNIINAILDWILIFGIEGWVPSYGVAGAAIATSGSQIFQAMILAFVFLKPANRLKYQTWDFKFNWSLFKKCFKVGFPVALFATFEIMGWAIFYMIMTWASPKHITIAGISQSIIILFYFFGEGISKGIATISGNYIGAQKLHYISRSVMSGVKLHLLFFLFLFVGFYFFADDLAGQFLNMPEAEITPAFLKSLQICVNFSILYLLFEGLRFVFMGVLTASGDTFFLLIGGAISIWLFLVIPVYIAVIKFQANIETASLISVFFAIGAFLIYYWRYTQGKWKTLQVAEAHVE